jgi:hypothetical protein
MKSKNLASGCVHFQPTLCFSNNYRRQRVNEIVRQRVYRVPGFLPTPRPLNRKQGVAPLWVQGGEHSLAGEGVERFTSYYRTDIICILYVYMYIV